MRQFFFTLAIGVSLAVATGVTSAQDGYPVRPVRIVVPFAPGGASDVLARTVGAKLAERLGQPVVVENKPGAATTIGAAEVARAPADGYTLMLAPAPFVITQFMYTNLPYDAPRDFTGVALVAASPLVITVNPSLDVKTVQELVAYSKAKPNAISYGSPGNGSVPHLATELLRTKTGANFTHVPYKGGGPAVTDLVAGHINLMLASPIEVSQHVAAGRLRYIAVTSAKRSPSVPEVPTIGESGIADMDVIAWFGIVAPAATPKAIVERLSQEIGRILEMPDVKEKLSALGADIAYRNAADFNRYLASERIQWSEVVKMSGAKMD